ncbi:unnamed protein product [Spirodela intermedia]|nr:unnamed protein product [Spirodela intermedia]
MAMRDVFLESFLFNPPYLSAPLHRIKNHKLKQSFQITKAVTKTVVALATDRFGDSSEAASFEIISRWAPSLFVNPSDTICAEYIDYFGVREFMAEHKLEFIWRTSARVCISARTLAIWREETEALHLLPSADLHVSSCASSGRRAAHSIQQWWRSDLAETCSRHRYHSE